MDTVAYVMYGLAFLVLAYNFMLKYFSWRDGKFYSWVFVLATMFGFWGTMAGKGRWWIFFVILFLDWIPPMFLNRHPRRKGDK